MIRSSIALSVNVDHIATLRQARGTSYPDPVAAASIAERTGAKGITVHLRKDRRHIQDSDVERLRKGVQGKMNLEISIDEEMLTIAQKIRPDQVTLVPERPGEVTTEGGLDLEEAAEEISAAAKRLAGNGIAVSLFVDPDAAKLELLEPYRDHLTGIEINTDKYTQNHTGKKGKSELRRIKAMARAARKVELEVYAGHGLTTENVGSIASIREITELNIGHWLIARAALVGIRKAVTEMLTTLRASRGRG